MVQRHYEMEKQLFFVKNRCCIEGGTCGGRRFPTIGGICGRNSWIPRLCVLLNLRMGRAHFQHVFRLFIIILYVCFASINGSLFSNEESIFLVLVMMRGDNIPFLTVDLRASQEFDEGPIPSKFMWRPLQRIKWQVCWTHRARLEAEG